MSFKQIAVLVGLAVIAVAVAYFTCGLGYVFAVVSTATFCWLVPFKAVLKGVAAAATWILKKVEPKKAASDAPPAA